MRFLPSETVSLEGADQDIMTQQQMIQLSKQARRHRSVPAGSMPACLTASHVTGGCVSAVVYHADASTWRAQTGSAIGPSFQCHPSPPILVDASVGSVTRMPRRNARPERQFGRLVSNGEACPSLSLSVGAMLRDCAPYSRPQVAVPPAAARGARPQSVFSTPTVSACGPDVTD